MQWAKVERNPRRTPHAGVGGRRCGGHKGRLNFFTLLCTRSLDPQCLEPTFDARSCGCNWLSTEHCLAQARTHGEVGPRPVSEKSMPQHVCRGCPSMPEIQRHNRKYKSCTGHWCTCGMAVTRRTHIVKDPHTCIVKELRFLLLLGQGFQISFLLLTICFKNSPASATALFFFWSITLESPTTLEEQNEQSNRSRV